MAAKNVIIIVVYSPVFLPMVLFPVLCYSPAPVPHRRPPSALTAMRRGGSLVQLQCLPGGRAGPAWLGLVPGRRWRPGTIPGAASRHDALVLGSRILLPSAGNKQY